MQVPARDVPLSGNRTTGHYRRTVSVAQRNIATGAIRTSKSAYAVSVQFDEAIDREPRAQPQLHLVDPSPATARRRVLGLASTGQLTSDQLSGLEIAVSEIVTNAHAHGQAPVLVRAWLTGEKSIVVIVDDGGDGPYPTHRDHLRKAPSPESHAGRGLWICAQVVADLSAWRRPDRGYAVRIAVAE